MANSWQPGRSPVFTLVAQISAPVADGKLVSAGELQEAVSPEHLDGGSVNYWSVQCGLQKHLTIDSSSGGKEPWSRRFPEWGVSVTEYLSTTVFVRVILWKASSPSLEFSNCPGCHFTPREPVETWAGPWLLLKFYFPACFPMDYGLSASLVGAVFN